MLKTLVLKQLMEVFRMYFYDAKKNKALSKGSTVARFILFFFLMFGLIGGTFTFLSIMICPIFFEADMGWLYFALFTVISIFMGVFGSVFTTYASLYLAKDNDLMLSLPIPISYIILSRVLNVYILGLMYSAIIILPPVIVFFFMGPVTFASVIGCIMLILQISILVLTLSCLLGWVVAKISTKLKNRSFITVFISLVFFAVYYVAIFKAQDIITGLIENIAQYGENLKDAFYPVYFVGSVGEGNWLAILVVTAIVAALFAAVWFLMRKSFLSITTSNASAGSVKKKDITKDITAASQSPFKSLFSREMSRFTSSANYMLNCGLGAVFIVILGGALLIKGPSLIDAINQSGLPIDPSAFAPVIIMVICFCLSMTDIAVPSVSLEGKSIWIVKSLPVTTWEIFKSKIAVQLVLGGVPTLFASVCAAIVLHDSITDVVFLFVTPMLFNIMYALVSLVLSIQHVNLNWTNETYPIKQGAGVMIALFGSWAFLVLITGIMILGYFFTGMILPNVIFCLISIVLGFLAYRWLRTKGTRIFNNL